LKATNSEPSALAAFLVFFAGTVLVLNLQTWAVMLAVGALHHAAPDVPSLSYGACGWLVFLAYLLVFPASVSGKASTR
jgi:hypothetical protein